MRIYEDLKCYEIIIILSEYDFYLVLQGQLDACTIIIKYTGLYNYQGFFFSVNMMRVVVFSVDMWAVTQVILSEYGEYNFVLVMQSLQWENVCDVMMYGTAKWYEKNNCQWVWLFSVNLICIWLCSKKDYEYKIIIFVMHTVHE